MENDLHIIYDSLCYATFANIRHLTKDSKRIVLRNFNWEDEDHKFIIAIINACYSLFEEKEVAIDANFLVRKTIEKQFKSIGKIRRAKKSDNIFIDVEELLEYMYPTAIELCGLVFTFSDIYKEYYAGKE
jgi:hypothetical protein